MQPDDHTIPSSVTIVTQAKWKGFILYPWWMLCTVYATLTEFQVPKEKGDEKNKNIKTIKNSTLFGIFISLNC